MQALQVLILLEIVLLTHSDGWNLLGFEEAHHSEHSPIRNLSVLLADYVEQAGNAVKDRGVWAALRSLGGFLSVGGGGSRRALAVGDLGAFQALSHLLLLNLSLSAETRPLRVGNRSDMPLGSEAWRQSLAGEVRKLVRALPGERQTIGTAYVALYWVMVAAFRPDADGLVRAEGFASLTQAWWLSRQASRADVRKVCEVGFNGGHSSVAMLAGAPPGASLVSFDLGSKSYTPACASFVGEVFPDRFTLVLGPSAETIPRYAYQHVAASRCDLIYIDGGHSEEDASADLLFMSLMATHGRTLVVMDDIHCSSHFCAGPTAAWDSFKLSGRLTELGCEVEENRGWCWGVFS